MAANTCQKSDGRKYTPEGKPAAVCEKGEFIFAAAALDHGHIFGQTAGLVEAGGQLKWIYDSDLTRAKNFHEKYPDAQIARSLDEILADSSVHMVTSAAIPSERCALGLRVLESGKDYFTDKAPFTTLDQLASARSAVEKTRRRYMVYFCERLHVECAVFAGELVSNGAIGKVVNVIGFGPHRLNASSRPEWFFQKEKYGGILTDIGSHQFEQFLAFSGSTDATVEHARVANVCNPDYPELEDFGEATLLGNSGASNHTRVDWLTPDGLTTWGDGRTTILGTKGTIELRKYVNVATQKTGDHLFIVNDDGEQHLELAGKVGFPFFGQLILDCLNRTENAMTQEHAFKAAELCLLAQAKADAS